jgi:hypothetical protein
LATCTELLIAFWSESSIVMSRCISTETCFH